MVAYFKVAPFLWGDLVATEAAHLPCLGSKLHLFKGSGFRVQGPGFRV